MDPGPHRGHAFAADSDPPMLVDTDYDVVIAGASFAGLAVAQRLGRPRAENSDTRQRRIAVLDRAPVGDGVTSACAAPVSIVHAMGAADSIRQVHDRLLIHTPSSRAVWSLPESFCTFDYRQFCQRAFEYAGVDFIQASVTGRSGSIVQTTTGDVSGKFLVDATGWRAVLLGGPTSPLVNRRWMAFGIESEVEGTFEPGLHFYFLPEVRDGYAWAFPAGGGIRFGVLSYLGRSRLHGALEQFIAGSRSRVCRRRCLRSLPPADRGRDQNRGARRVQMWGTVGTCAGWRVESQSSRESVPGVHRTITPKV